jgi:hypothetical protein
MIEILFPDEDTAAVRRCQSCGLNGVVLISGIKDFDRKVRKGFAKVAKKNKI